MTTADLKTLFGKEYNRTEWIIALQEIFHIKDLHVTPHTVNLGENPFGASAVELGHFETSEGLKIGLYEVSISNNKLLGKNKVGLRNLMRKVYQEDGDAALIVFTQDHTWRFTYASELTVTNPETGLRERKQTDPKRYTYIFGRNQLCRTAAERFAGIKSSADQFDTHIAISEIEKAFSVDVLTKDFYRELSNWYFWALTKVKFPANTVITDEVNNATSLIRLITRLIFVWFMKQKGLIPDELFDKEEVDQLINPTDSTGSTYYKAILQNLFFATLNTPIKEGNRSFVRRQTGNQDFYRYQRFFKNKERFLELTSDIPFLNGGLFDNLDKRIAKGDPEDVFIDCFSNHQENESLLVLPDFLFFGGAKDVDLSESYDDIRKKHQDIRGIIDILHNYNFTVEENTPLEIQIALDPEMLGKVFENLLASYNPETKSTARKQTGSFYTPREIVNYMVDESLIAYLNQKLSEESLTSLNEDNPEINLRTLVSYSNDANPFNEIETQTLVNAIGSIKVLDPACGSGAFPMGILQQLVHVLTKLDPENSLWREYQINKAQDEIKEALRENDKEVRHLRLKEIEDAFSLNEEDYGRKLFLIENCIYGIDIQPIAVQISKLRFFISLICEQNKQPGNAENFGIKSLPNLETKFVAANTLIGLEIDPQIEIRTDDILKLEKELVRIRKNHFVERDKHRKKLLRDRDRETRDKILQCLHVEYESHTKALLSKIENEAMSLGSFEKQYQNEKLAGLRRKLEERMVQIKKEIWRLNEKVTKNQHYEQNLMNRAAWDPYNTNESSGFYDSEWMFGIEDGFDVVIGNPPYVDIKGLPKEDVRLYFRLFQTAENRINLYSIFIEKGVSLLNQFGILTFINPNSILINESYKKIRKHIVEGVEKIIKLPDSVFETATVETIILITRKKSAQGEILGVFFANNAEIDFNHLSFNTFQRKEWMDDEDSRFNIFSESKIIQLLKKIENSSQQLDKFVFTSLGITPYDKYKGHSDELIKNREYHSDKQLTSQYVPLISGKNIHHYYISNEVEEYLKYGDWLGASRDKKFFEGSKIVVRQILESNLLKIIAGYSDIPNYFTQIGFSLISKTNSESDLKFILSLLNSKLISFYHKNKFLDIEKIVFPKILIANCKQFPIKIAENKISFISIADNIISTKKSDPNSDTTALENQIDVMVYKLYELTYEEVLVVDPEFWMARGEFEVYFAESLINP